MVRLDDVVVCYVHEHLGGWRWAVHVGHGGPGDLTHCLNAGWAPEKNEATTTGDGHMATAVVALRSAGVAASYAGVMLLDTDPAAHLAATNDDRVRII